MSGKRGRRKKHDIRNGKANGRKSWEKKITFAYYSKDGRSEIVLVQQRQTIIHWRRVMLL